jgi:hypothetical protein
MMPGMNNSVRHSIIHRNSPQFFDNLQWCIRRTTYYDTSQNRNGTSYPDIGIAGDSLLPAIWHGSPGDNRENVAAIPRPVAAGFSANVREKTGGQKGGRAQRTFLQ